MLVTRLSSSWMMIEARWHEMMVSSAHPSADERVAEAIARVLSRYCVDFTSGVELIMTDRGVKIHYLAKAHVQSRV
jgi:hypothetical protein